MNKVKAIVVGTKKLWWIKVKRKMIRIGLNDGVTYPHIIEVKYTVNNVEYVSKKYLRSSIECPKIGEEVLIYYNETKPSKITKIMV